jgi:tetratricopeptide (TPR) repeat protein
MPFRGREVPADSIALALQVGTVVEGSIDVQGDRVKVALEVIDGQSGTPFQRKSFEEPLTDVATLRQTVITETARLLRQWIGEEVNVRKRAETTNNNGAWMQLQRAEKTRKDAEAKLAAGDLRGAVSLLESVDERLAEAEEADPAWPDPVVERAAVNYRLAYLAQNTPETAVPFIDTGLGHADRALELDRTSARALELRGTLNYFRWLLRVTPDPEEQAALKDRAKTDLEAAVRFDASLASAYATLAHLYSQENVADEVVAATRAYEEDAYLQNANVVLWRLFNGSLNLGNFTNARRWCAEGTRRFPEDYRFVSCQLRLFTTPGTEPDVAAAWALLAQQDSLVPAARREFERTRGELLLGGILARAGQQDSAGRVIARAARRVTAELDPTQELLLSEAYVRLLNGEADRSVDLLTRYAATRPDEFSANKGEVQWYWRDLQDHPRARKLFALD